MTGDLRAVELFLLRSGFNGKRLLGQQRGKVLSNLLKGGYQIGRRVRMKMQASAGRCNLLHQRLACLIGERDRENQCAS